MEKSNINKVSSPRNVVGDLRLINSLYKKVFSLFNTTKSAEDSPQRHWGMTSLFNYGFTLIELLVVVLIIGILAAIALPQYQKAVMKSRYAAMKLLINSIEQAQKVYFLANNSYTTNFNDLDIEVGGTPPSQDNNQHRLFNWGFCRLETEYAYCKNTTINVSLTTDYSSGKRICQVYSGASDLVQQLCQNETGDTSSTTNANKDTLYGYN